MGEPSRISTNCPSPVDPMTTMSCLLQSIAVALLFNACAPAALAGNLPLPRGEARTPETPTLTAQEAAQALENDWMFPIMGERSQARMAGPRRSWLAEVTCLVDSSAMSALEVIEQIKALPPTERAAVARFVLKDDDSWIPEEFKEAMADAQAGRTVDMETALFETPPPRLQ